MNAYVAAISQLSASGQKMTREGEREGERERGREREDRGNGTVAYNIKFFQLRKISEKKFKDELMYSC